MGYEVRLIIGKPGLDARPEYEEDKSKPFEDGSGFEYKEDANGKPVPTGRMERWFQDMAEIELCKIGQGPLANLIHEASKEAERNSKMVYYFYGCTDGNRAAREDDYGDKFWPVPVEKVLEAIKAEDEPDYRRFKWAIALLEAMKDDTEQLEVIFWGH